MLVWIETSSFPRISKKSREIIFCVCLCYEFLTKYIPVAARKQHLDDSSDCINEGHSTQLVLHKAFSSNPDCMWRSSSAGSLCNKHHRKKSRKATYKFSISFILWIIFGLIKLESLLPTLCIAWGLIWGIFETISHFPYYRSRS